MYSLSDAPSEACFSQQQQQQQDSEVDHSEGNFPGGGTGGRGGNGSGEGPFVVLYLIEPFTYGQRDSDLSRLAMFGILRCYHDLLRSLPEQMQRRVQLQVSQAVVCVGNFVSWECQVPCCCVAP